MTAKQIGAKPRNLRTSGSIDMSVTMVTPLRRMTSQKPTGGRGSRA